MRDLLAVLCHLSSIPEDQIPQLTQKMLNLIGQVVNSAVAQSLKSAINKALDQWKRLKQFCHNFYGEVP